MQRRYSRKHYHASPSHSSHYRYVSHYREPPQYREGCFTRAIRTLTNIALIVLITGVTVLLLVFAITHFNEIKLLIKAIFTVLSFIISIFPLLLRGGLLIIALVALLGILRGFIHLVSNIRERSAQASLASAQAKQAHLQVKLQKDRGKLEVQQKQVVLAQQNHAYNQQVQQDYGDASSQQPKTLRATRNLALEGQATQQQLNEGQSAQTPPSTPSISQLLGTSVRAGQMDMLHGFETIRGSLQEVRGELPITAIVAGRGGSGKTRRIILMVFQAILTFQAMGGGKITICDPHWIKSDGLANMLEPFRHWLYFARTNEEIIAAAKEHIAEMESRLTPQGSIHGEGLQPRLIIIDEFVRLMKSEHISTKEKHILTKCVRETAVQWRGVSGRAWIGGQEFTQDAIGDTAIRKDAQAIFCHQLSDEYATFLFPRDGKAQRLVQQIGRRESVYKDEDNGVRRVATITVNDSEIATMVAYLTRFVPSHGQTIRIPPRTRMSSTISDAQGGSSQTVTQQGAFYTAPTVDLRPKQPVASATWGEDQGDDRQRRHYGAFSPRLHPTVPASSTADTQISAPILHHFPSDNTVLISEEVIEASSQARRSQTSIPLGQAPSTESLTQRRRALPRENSLDALVAARDKKKKR